MAGPSKPHETVERHVRAKVAQVAAIETEALEPTMEVLLEARRELHAGLRAWIDKAPGNGERFTAHRMRVALQSIDGALKAAGRLPAAMAQGLDEGRHATGTLAADGLDEEVARLADAFGRSLIPPQIDTAAVLARGDKLLFRQHRTSAARYGGQVGDDIRRQFGIGVAKGETYEQLINRLRRLGGPHGRVALRGVLGEPGTVSAEIAEGLFNRHRFWAERLVRTEMMNAYNVQHAESIRLLNDDLDDDEEPFKRRWDSTADLRRCAMCRHLHGRIAEVGAQFADGIRHPPAHPMCRCVELAWREDWGGEPGEEQPTHGAAPDTRRRAPQPERPNDGPVVRKPKPPPEPPKPKLTPEGFDDGGKTPIAGLPKRSEIRARAVHVVDPEKIRDRLIALPMEKLDAARMQKIRDAWASGKRLKPVQLAMLPDGRLFVEDGRHRLLVALEQNRPVLVKLSKGRKGVAEGTAPLAPRHQAAKPHAGPEVATEAPTTPPKQPKNAKRVAAAKKGGEASAERKREIHSAAKTNLPQELHAVWDKEGHKFMREEAARIKGVKDRVNASSTLSQAFIEKYGSGGETAFGNEGDRFHRRAEIEATHAEEWADEQERKYYEAALKAARHNGEIDDDGDLTPHGKSEIEPAPAPSKWWDDDGDPPF